MPGTSNFLQWNPTQANQESDATFATDPQRLAGAANPSEFASALGNKCFYQWSTFVAAFAQMMATKGYTMSDASLATLASVLAAVVTDADIAGILATYFPWTQSQGGTGATSLNAAKIANRVGQYDITGHTGTITAQVIGSSLPAGRYTAKWNAHMASGSIGTALTVTITWTQGGVTHTVDDFSPVESTDTQCDSGELNIYPDAGSSVTVAQTESAANPYDLHAWLEAM
jgi:hypothetical protein